jgi:hypothetical protein
MGTEESSRTPGALEVGLKDYETGNFYRKPFPPIQIKLALKEIWEPGFSSASFRDRLKAEKPSPVAARLPLSREPLKTFS